MKTVADGILIDLTVEDLELLIKSLEEFKESDRYLIYRKETKIDFDKLLKKLKNRKEEKNRT